MCISGDVKNQKPVCVHIEKTWPRTRSAVRPGTASGCVRGRMCVDEAVRVTQEGHLCLGPKPHGSEAWPCLWPLAHLPTLAGSGQVGPGEAASLTSLIKEGENGEERMGRAFEKRVGVPSEAQPVSEMHHFVGRGRSVPPVGANKWTRAGNQNPVWGKCQVRGGQVRRKGTKSDNGRKGRSPWQDFGDSGRSLGLRTSALSTQWERHHTLTPHRHLHTYF